ncbi:hypothetical protein CUMW_250930 [Citrus unshiu]|uniref:Uncharacterized protein n=1 Tax=Citrus unshiu TaxID=55188 RepID=A0A2H5QQ06_CITUN|nr:hypothetical protein CUMW_250930 [Citrus unshiu]
MIMFTSPILCEVRMSSLTHVLSRKTLPHAILVWAYDKNLVTKGEFVTLVQSGAQPIWRQESTHHIQVRKVQG